MLGQYPGQVPADFPSDTQQGRDRIRDVVLGGGVTDLLSLQVGIFVLAVRQEPGLPPMYKVQ